MCTAVQVLMVDPVPGLDLEDICGILLAHGFNAGIGTQNSKKMWFAIDAYMNNEGEEVCLCGLDRDATALARLKDLLADLLARCGRLYYAGSEFAAGDPELNGDSTEKISPGMVAGTHRPGAAASWYRIVGEMVA